MSCFLRNQRRAEVVEQLQRDLEENLKAKGFEVLSWVDLGDSVIFMVRKRVC